MPNSSACQETYELCSQEMDRKLTAGEAFRLRFHLMMCGVCRHLPAQFRGLRTLVRACAHDHGHEESSDEHLPPESKARIAECLRSQSKSKY